MNDWPPIYCSHSQIKLALKKAFLIDLTDLGYVFKELAEFQSRKIDTDRVPSTSPLIQNQLIIPADSY